MRTRVVDGEVVDCFVAAKDTQGLPYDAEILGDDEYRDGIERKLADAHMAAAAPDLVEALRSMLSLVRRNAPELSGKVLGDAEAALAKAGGELFNTEAMRHAAKDER